MKIHAAGTEFFLADRHTDNRQAGRHDEANSRFLQYKRLLRSRT